MSSLVGFLIRKTVQPHSQRTDHSNFNDFRDTNMVMYINKKVGDVRSRYIIYKPTTKKIG